MVRRRLAQNIVEKNSVFSISPVDDLTSKINLLHDLLSALNYYLK